MFLGRVNNVTSTTGNIPITTVLNTNNKINNDTVNNVLDIYKTGIYNLDGYLTVTGLATTNVIATVYADGVARATTPEVTLTAATDFATIPIVDALRVVATNTTDIANVSIRLNVAGLTVNGNIRLEYLQ